MTPRLRNTSHPAAVASRRFGPALAALLAVVLVALACTLAACSGGSSDAESLLADTFQSHAPIESGRVDLSLALTAPAKGAKGTPSKLLGVGLSGPFEGLGSGRLPDFALQLELTEAGHTLVLGATSTDGKLYIAVAGTQFEAPASVAQQLQQSYAQTTRASSSASSRSTFAALGIEPGEWIVDPQIVSEAGETTHITGKLDTQRFLADAQKLSGASGALGLAGSTGLSSSGKLAELAGSVTSARVDVYTGTHDHLLRRLLLTAAVAATPKARAALGVSSGAVLTLDLRFAEVNQPQKIAAPAHVHSISELAPELEALGSSLGAG